jgi:glycosyltransferase involved in cell wall biosynthesis
LTDVVIVTLMRDTLQAVIESVKNSVPDANFILVTDKGLIGDLRNRGLNKATGEFVCFGDDDIIVSREWYEKCTEILKNDIVLFVSLAEQSREHVRLECL